VGFRQFGQITGVIFVMPPSTSFAERAFLNIACPFVIDLCFLVLFPEVFLVLARFLFFATRFFICGSQGKNPIGPGPGA
jgi:hypothetical protein